MVNADDINKKAEDARESGDFLEALKFADEATFAYQKEGNINKMGRVQASRSLTLRHLFDSTGEKAYLSLAKYSAKAAVKILEDIDDKASLGVAKYTLAKCYETLGKYDKSVAEIKGALDLVDDSNRAMLAEMKTRLASLECRLGDDSAIDLFAAETVELENADMDDKYLKNVWLSGAHMHMAESYIARADTTRAKEEIEKARVIVDSDARLILRAKQLEKIEDAIE